MLVSFTDQVQMFMKAVRVKAGLEKETTTKCLLI